MVNKGVNGLYYYNNIMKQVKKIISERIFRQQKFNSSYEQMSNLFKTIPEMEINQELFRIIRILIKFFRLPSLILFKPIYQKIERNQQKYLQQTRQDLLKTAAHVKALVKEKQFHSLDFYFKAGCDRNIPEALLKTDQKSLDFMSFLLKLEEMMSSIPPTIAAESKMLADIQQIIRQYIRRGCLVIEQLCLEAYHGIIKDRQAQINKQQMLQQNKHQIIPQLRSRTKIRIQAYKDGEKIIEDPETAGLDLCCRPYFYMDEIIQQPQTLVQQYKNYSYPFQGYCGDILTKTICGFLNGKGGIIYIGIKEDASTKKRTVYGQKYSQSSKEKLLTYFRIRCQKISPQIVNQQFYKIQYVPIKDPSRNNAWMPGMFILRIKVQRGNKNDLYSYKKDDGEQFFAFRTENQVLTNRIGQHILEVYRQRLNSDDSFEPGYLNHPGPCRPVEIGKQVFEQDHYQVNPWDKKQSIRSSLYDKYEGKYDYRMD